MRVCMFVMLVPAHVTGGMEIHSMELAKSVAKAGHEVVVLTSRHPEGVEKEVVDGVEVYYVNVRATSKTPLGRKCLRRLEELHAERRFDVLHSQSFSAYYYVKDGLRQRLGIPLVTTLHGTSFSEIKSNLNQGLSLMLLPKIVFQLYNHYFKTTSFIRESDAVIAISRELAENIPAEYNISPDKVHTIINGIDTDAFKPAESKVKSRLQGKKIVLSVSVLHKQKGVQYLIKAFKKVQEKIPDTQLLVVGDGPYRKRLEGLSENLGLQENVLFTGRIPNAETADYYNACNVFVMPTVRVEGLPLIELEAMACGKPVVASNIGGIPSVIEDGVNGLLVKPGDVDELAGKIIDVLEDEKLAAGLGKNARKTIAGKYSREKMAADTIKVYEKVAGGSVR
jgi:N-acetyl-alpha-D-glucosaminyl L-malate synthase BshA